MAETFANFATSTLNGAINNSTTSITVTSGTSFPSTGDFRILVDSELMLCTARSGNVLTVTRAIESTSAVSHNDGSVVTHILTAGTIAALKAEAAPTSVSSSSSPYTITSANVNTVVAITATADFTINLPSSRTAGQRLYVRRASGAGRLFMSRNSGAFLVGGYADGLYCSSADVYDDGTDIVLGKVAREERAHLIGGVNTLTGNHQFDVVTLVWASKAACSSRYYQLAGRFDGGGFHSGGYNGSVNVNTSEYYSVSGNSWSSKAADTVATRSSHSGAAVGDKLYGYGASVTTNSEYSWTGNSWSSKQAALTAKWGGGFGEISGICQYATGQLANNSYTTGHEVYTPGTNSWASKSANTGTARNRVGWYTNETSIGVFGGYNGSNLTEHQGYSATGNAWASRTAYAGNGLGPSSCKIQGGVFSAGGHTSTSAYVYYTATNTWHTSVSYTPSGGSFYRSEGLSL